MKTFHVAIAFLLASFSAESAISQTSNSKNVVSEARRNYTRIERNLKDYTRLETDFPDQSSEGGTFIVYFHKGAPRKIVAHFYGEMGNFQTDYYFCGGRLFYVLETRIRYDKPLGKEESCTQNRFYFTNGRLTRWLDNKGTTRNHLEKTFKAYQTKKLHDARQYVTKANKLLD